ncbi:MAG: hypothetical protein ABJP45_17940 [Cyclobacteriaceae bacterium]
MFFIADTPQNPADNNNNPAHLLTQNLKGSEIEYPDPNTYFILSDIGKNHHIIDNETILLTLRKGYFEPIFSLDVTSKEVISLSQELFSNTKPIDAGLKRAIDIAISRSTKTSTRFRNRL